MFKLNQIPPSRGSEMRMSSAVGLFKDKQTRKKKKNRKVRPSNLVHLRVVEGGMQHIASEEFWKLLIRVEAAEDDWED